MDRLVAKVSSYLKKSDIGLLEKAIKFAKDKHKNQKRKSGKPYHTHPISVANIIADMNLDMDSIITALLHDVVEDTDTLSSEIEKNFGQTIAKLVNGVTKLTQFKFKPDHIKQAENFRKLLLAISEDIRVLIVKLADRLDNMRSIDYHESVEQKIKIAVETMEIYAPLAERIGMQQIKLELQDISFRVLHGDIRDSILERLKRLSVNGPKYIAEITQHLKDTLKNSGINVEIQGRQKTPYSIWMKMQQKKVGFEQLSDIIAFRIITKNPLECYSILGIIHSKYKMVPESFQDFISTPKKNGYQSLHTLIIGPKHQRVEIQIRTYEMHDIAELGVAAHWSYKQNYSQKDNSNYVWVKDLLDILKYASNHEEFLQNTKLAMYYDQVFCFTPKGDLISLPRGATPVDFAFMVDSKLGKQCIGTKVNSINVPLDTKLSNGDQIEIITSEHQNPLPEWEKFVVTGQAKSEIRKSTISEEILQYSKFGISIITKELNNIGINDIDKTINEILPKLNHNNIDDLYYDIGKGTISKDTIIKEIINSKPELLVNIKDNSKKNKKSPISINGFTSGIVFHFAKCCTPIKGDQIIGIEYPNFGIVVHCRDCSNINYDDLPKNKVVDLSWNEDIDDVSNITKIKLIIVNQIGSLASVFSTISRHGMNIIDFKLKNRSQDFFEILIYIDVPDVKNLEQLLISFKSIQLIYLAERIK